MSVTIEQLERLVQQTEDAVIKLERHFAPPDLVDIGGKPFFRHARKNDLLMSYLKCVRAVSSLNASLVLLRHGYIQEIGTLCRCIDDYCQDILFIGSPLGEDGKPSEQQRRLVEEFFQEEFDDLDNPLCSRQIRNRVPRSKVHAGIARMTGNPINPSDLQDMYRSLHKAFSGYVHGAYVHIMEIYGGKRKDLRYHMRGLQGTPRIPEWTETLSIYAYRTLIAVEVVARRCNDTEVQCELSVIGQEFENDTGIGGGDPDALLKRLK